MNDIGPKGFFDNLGSDGSSPAERVKRHGSSFAGIEQSITCRGITSARDIVLSFLVNEDGQSK